MARYYEVQYPDGSPRYQTLDKIDAEFFVAGLIKRGEKRPTIHEVEKK